jgi:hypothetical protein
MLTELQAWELLWEGFSKPSRIAFESRDGWAEIQERYSECLCDAIMYLQTDKYITRTLEISMKQKIARYADPNGVVAIHNFLWPRNQLGALERAAFCARMLKELYKEMFNYHGMRGVTDPYSMWYI